MTLVVGVGGRPGASPAALSALVDSVLGEHGSDAAAVGVVATLDRRAGEPGIRLLAARRGARVVSLGAHVLAAQRVPHPSEVVRRHLGLDGVAEAAVLACGARLVSPRRAAAGWTVALGRVGQGQAS